MKVFVTGASGFIGSAVVPELIGAGHQVTGLARSDASAAAIEKAGAGVLRGALEDLDALRRGAAEADGVIHLAFIHDFTNMPAAAAADRAAIEAIGAVLAGSNKPVVTTTGTMTVAAGGVATEDDVSDGTSPAAHRALAENQTIALAAKGVRASVIRLSPSVHGDGDHGFVPALIGLARAKGAAMYVGDGQNRWPAVHRLDAARLYRLALERGVAGSRFHGVADEGIPVKQIAEFIAARLGVRAVSTSPEDAAAQLGFIGRVLAVDNPTSSAKTRAALGWDPTHAGLLEDLETGTYFG